MNVGIIHRHFEEGIHIPEWSPHGGRICLMDSAVFEEWDIPKPLYMNMSNNLISTVVSWVHTSSEMTKL